jgi:hypothetical protein
MEVTDKDSAVTFINNYTSLPDNHQLEYFEIIVTYNNGSDIQCHFKEKEEVIDFLTNKI